MPMNKGRAYGFSAELERKSRATYAERLDKELECRAWIEAITGEELEPVESGWDNFSAALKNGVILCKLINVISPRSVKKIHDSKMEFKMMENIGNFLTACESIGVQKADLFQTVDLFEGRNMNSVLTGLEALGRKAQQIGFRGPTFGAKPSSENKREFSEETLKAGQNVIGLQMGTNQGANRSGISYGSRRQVYDPQLKK
ncbi:muscle-specific protein 20-like [Acanthaster planci]|uniref:Muscle-specific protein 20-like n=1 Tax=Acanthaster planci TaxID=133434 RepID=A0A8B7ZY97_ACAPL|nr:muscle-specific protein 20-like [Acanthaster planci]